MEYLPERLSDAGYMTAAVGCYDHAPDESPLGYQYRKLFLGDMEGCDYAKFLNEKHPEATGVYPHDDKGRFLYDEEDFYDRWSADCATEFIERYTKTGKAPDGTAPRNENAPFFLYCGFLSPHMPLIPPREVAGTVDPDRLPPVLLLDRPDEDIPSVERYRRAFLNTHLRKGYLKFAI